MKIEHLGYVLEAVRCGSINRAARNLFFSQSNLSSIIKNIELELGYPILDRTKEGVVPTEEGTIFLRCAEKILAEYEKMRGVPGQMEKTQDISILCSRSPFVMRCFFQFRKNESAGSYRDTFQELGIKNNVDAIITHKGRIGVIAILKQKMDKYREIAESYGLDLEILQDNIPLVLMMSPEHELAARESVSMSEISLYPFVADLDVDYDDTLGVYDITDMRKVLYVTDRSSTYEAVRHEQYLSTILGVDAPDAEQHHCICRPVEGFEDGMVLFYIKLKDTVPNRRERDFLEYLRIQLKRAGRRF